MSIDRPLTLRQQDTLRAIKDYRARTGLMPTISEIGEAIGVRSTNGVCDHLRALERKGYVKTPGTAIARGLQLTEKAWGPRDIKPTEPALIRYRLGLDQDAGTDAVLAALAKLLDSWNRVVQTGRG